MRSVALALPRFTLQSSKAFGKMPLNALVMRHSMVADLRTEFHVFVLWRFWFACLVASGFLMGVVPAGTAVASAIAPGRHALPNRHTVRRGAAASSSHVVVIVQENRTVDNLFNGFPGANTVTVDPYSKTVLKSQSLASPVGYVHGHKYTGGFVSECYAKTGSTACRMDFAKAFPQHCGSSDACTAFVYVPQSEIAPDWSIASQGELLDDMFQCNQGSSFPAHQCMIAGQDGGFLASGEVDTQNPYAYAEDGKKPNCENPHSKIPSVNVTAPYPGKETNQYACATYMTIFDEAAAAGLTWRYYVPKSAGYWCGPCNVAQDYKSPNLISPDWQFFADLAAGKLANITYVMPEAEWSDHPSDETAGYWYGTDWVGNIVNSIEASPFASSTEILITWDDWGGLYDHVVPPILETNAYGFRVPGVIIGPGVIPNQVDHTEHNQASFILGTIEAVFGLPSLNQEDAAMAPFENFDFMSYPGAPSYTPVPVHSPPSWYPQQGSGSGSESDPDSD